MAQKSGGLSGHTGDGDGVDTVSGFPFAAYRFLAYLGIAGAITPQSLYCLAYHVEKQLTNAQNIQFVIAKTV
jgi:hypothetical protein